MLNELVKQWWRLVFWWVPQQETRQESAGSEQSRSSKSAAPAAPAQPSAKASPAKAAAKESPAPSASSSSVAQAGSVSQRDDLTALKGIGEAMEQKLNKAGIASFGDLASADAESLTAELKKSQPVLSAAKVQGWIDEARQRAAH